MYLMYIDESGDTISLSEGGKRFLVLTGCVIHEQDLKDIESSFRRVKNKYYRNQEIEIKSNFLRYANPDLTANSPLKLKSRKKYDNLESELAIFLKGVKVILFSVVVCKKPFWREHSNQNPYHMAYIRLLESFQKYLKSKNSLGICIIDPREGQTEKHFMGNELNTLHEKMRHRGGSVWKKCSNVVEKLLFSQSDQTVGIQIADLYCYPIFHVFEYDKKPEDYWRFNELSRPKLNKGGLNIFPIKTKKDLKFFS